MGVVVQQSIKGTVVNYAGMFIGFLTTFFVLTHFLTQEEIGLTRVLIDAATLLAGLAQLGTNGSAMRYYPYFKSDADKDHGFFFWTVFVPFVGFLIYGIVFLLAKEGICSAFSENSSLFVDYYYFIFPLGFSLLYMGVFDTNANLLMRIVVPKFIREVVVRVLSLVVYLLYAFDVLSLDGFVLAFCSVYVVATLLDIAYLFSLKRVSFKPDLKFISKPLRRDYLRYTFYVSTYAIIATITPSINTFFISAQMGLAYTGIYTIANYMVTLIETPYRSLGAISLPHISQSVKDGDFVYANQLSKNISKHQFLAATMIFFAIWTNIDLIFTLLPNGEDYAAGKWVVLILGVQKIFASSLSVGFSVLGYSKYYYSFLFFSVVLTVTAIVLNNQFIPLWGMTGAALATFVANLVYFSMLIVFIFWKLRIFVLSRKHISILMVVLCMFAAAYVWQMFLTPLFGRLPWPSEYGLLLDGVLKTGLLMSGALVAVYKLNISDEINGIIRGLLSRLHIK